MEHRLERVQRYLDGLLSDEENAAFEADMKENKTLVEDLRFVQLERKITASSGDDPKELQLQAWNRAYRKRRRLMQLGIWGLILLLIAFLAWWIFKEEPTTAFQDQVLALYEKPADSSTLERTFDTDRGKEEIPTLNTAGQYREAHQLFQNKKYEAAEQKFSALIPDIHYGLDAEWFATLAYYLQRDAPSQVTPLLDSIIKDAKHPHTKNAEALIRLLNQDLR